MQTSFMTTISNSFKPWAALARDLADSNLEHAKSVGQLFTNGLDKTSSEQFTELAVKIGSDSLAASVKAIRLAATQSSEAVKGVQAQVPASASTILGADILQKMQAQFASAQDQFVGLIEKTVEVAAPNATARKASRA